MNKTELIDVKPEGGFDIAGDKHTVGAESVERKKTIKSDRADDETRACAESELISKFNRAGE